MAISDGNSALRLIGFCALMWVLTAALGAEQSSRNDNVTHQTKVAKGTRLGLATYYGAGLHGKPTASGEIFDKNEMVAAHPTYPIGTRLMVTNLENGRMQEVRIIDRGPTHKPQSRGVIVDVSERAAVKLGFRQKGKTRVKTEVLAWGEGN